MIRSNIGSVKDVRVYAPVSSEDQQERETIETQVGEDPVEIQ